MFSLKLVGDRSISPPRNVVTRLINFHPGCLLPNFPLATEWRLLVLLATERSDFCANQPGSLRLRRSDSGAEALGGLAEPTAPDLTLFSDFFLRGSWPGPSHL